MTKDKPTRLEAYQTRFLNDRSKFRLVVKSRQIGFSWIIAGEGLHTSLTSSGRKTNFISTNQNEAADKLDYARAFYHTIPKESGFRVPIWRDGEFELSFGETASAASVMLSQPSSSAVRGGEKDVYIDEAAFIRDAQKIYEAALPATVRSGGRMTVISTPYGQTGLFHDIANNPARYAGYSIHIVPWWECSIMSKDVDESTNLAPNMGTEDRVKKYGTDALLEVFTGAGSLDSFQQEFECSFADESVNFFPWDLIVGAADDTLNNVEVPKDIPLSIGIDLAKKIDKTVVTISHHDPETDVRTIYKTFESKDTYDEQINKISALVREIKPLRVSIDATGLGAVISEKLTQEFGGTIEPIAFTNALKEQWVTTFKGDLQLGRIKMPRQSQLMHEIHNIQRTKTEAGNYVFKARGEAHDDYMWSAILSLYGRGRTAPRISFAW